MIRDSRQSFEFSRLSSLLSRAFSRQDKKMKINGITIGSGTLKQYESYRKTLNAELLIMFFFLNWFFLSFCSQSRQQILKNPILDFPNKTIKPLLIWRIYLTLLAKFRITLALLNILHIIYNNETTYVNELILTLFGPFDIQCEKMILCEKPLEIRF